MQEPVPVTQYVYEFQLQGGRPDGREWLDHHKFAGKLQAKWTENRILERVQK